MKAKAKPITKTKNVTIGSANDAPTIDWLHEAFESYRLEVVPEGAGQTQIIETRRAFYAGAGIMLAQMLSTFAHIEECTNEMAGTELLMGFVNSATEQLEGYVSLEVGDPTLKSSTVKH